MSTAEPVSAYGVFKAAKTKADSHKKSKNSKGAQATRKGQTGGHNKSKAKLNKSQNAAEGATKKAGKINKLKANKLASTPKEATKSDDKVKTAANKLKNVTNAQTSNGKKSESKKTASKSKVNTIKDSEVVSLVEKLYDPDRKLNKAEQQKKKDLEDYLVKQLEMDDADEYASTEEGDETFNTIQDFSDSDEFSDEYSTDEFSGSEFDDATNEESFGGLNNSDITDINGDHDQSLAKTNKKRKNSETSLTKEKIVANKEVTDSKKSKISKDSKITNRKSLPADKTPTDTKDSKRRRSSLAAVEEFGKIENKSPATKGSTTTTVKLEPLSPPSNIVKVNSIEEGKRAFKWLLNPVAVPEFFTKYWEQKACLIKRQQSNYFSHLISFEGIDQMLLKNHVEFTKNIDVTSYKNGVRETLNPEGRAMPPVVWDHYGQGCSIRLLNPQTFLPGLYTLSSTMQEYFQCLVGANAYLTPPNSQGFAPHYDDIEAFVLQIEGRKRWKLYKPRNTAEILPRFSSGNFNQKEIGKPVLEQVLEPGDVLYFPRGTIHQACTEPGYHSLHITLSVYQKQSYADLFEKMLPLMLQKAIASNVDLRRGLPLHAWQHAGIAFSENDTKERADLTKKVTQLMQKCIKEMPLQDIMDSAIDQLAKKFQHEALPPEILPSEKIRTVFGSRSRTNERGECVCDYDIDERTNVRLLRANILRLVEEEEKIRIYYYLDNSKEYCQYEPNYIEIEAMEAASVEILIKSYPQYVGVSQLPLPSDDQKITLVTALWERGLLMMEKPFK